MPNDVVLEYQPGGNIVQIGQIGTALGNYFGYAINSSGVIAGGEVNWSGGFVNYTGQPGANVGLYGLLPSAVAAANTAMDAYGLDDNGDIAGLVNNPNTLAYTGYFLSPAIPGDANLDGRVDINDLTIVLAHYGSAGMAWTQGEFTGDGTVDINDLDDRVGPLQPDFGAAKRRRGRAGAGEYCPARRARRLSSQRAGDGEGALEAQCLLVANHRRTGTSPNGTRLTRS